MMFVGKIFTATVAACALAGLASCATPRGNLASEADQLEHNANALARDARDYPADRADRDYRPTYVSDVHALADDAHDFRRTAEDHRASDADIKASFERVSHSYHAVRDEVARSDNPEVRDDFKAVTNAYLNIERDMGGYPARSASAYPAER
jgi:hypothetical protein